jgi:hypothetical protein
MLWGDLITHHFVVRRTQPEKVGSYKTVGELALLVAIPTVLRPSIC